MIVIGVDVHKHSLTAAAVDQSGRLLAEQTLAGGVQVTALIGACERRARTVRVARSLFTERGCALSQRLPCGGLHRKRSTVSVFVNVTRDQSRTSQAVNSVESGLRSVEPARADALELDFAAIRKRET